MKKSNPKLKKEIIQYMLNDFQFLQDYEIIENCKYNKNTFIAQIKNSTQKVRFIKKKFSEEYFNRFKGLYKLYKNGIVLADNMFVIEQCEELFFYIIQAQLQRVNSRFKNLQQFLYENKPTAEQRKSIVSKIKILVDCLHQQGQTYGGLDPRSIIIDDQNHLYLAPFQLQYQLKTDNYTTAYYPPEILETINEGKLQIDQSNIAKWDYWSFGCIVAEVLLYGSPLFLDTSQNKQLKRIKQFAIGEQITTFDDPLKNIIINSLHKDPSKRNISTNSTVETKPSEIQQDFTKTIKTGTKLKPTNEDPLTQLNLYVDKQVGDSELILSLISLQNIEFKDELHIVVCLNKKYHFYIDYKQQTNKYKLNKKITIRDNFHTISKMLSEPIRIELKEKGQVTPILVNLQTLVIVQDKRRIWNKKLLGTYKPNKNSSHAQGKIKISCILNSPQTYIQDYQTKEQIQKDTVTQQPQVIQQTVETKVLTDVTNSIPIRKTSSKIPSTIPSISQISNNITTITEQFMHKLSLRQQNQDRAKSKSAKILQP